MPGQSSESLVDARTDLRWSKVVESLAERKEFQKLWHFAKTTPPIWTVRIIKFLQKQGWLPDEDDEPEFFQTISQYASACNEFDLPGPDLRPPKITTYARQFCTARITSDGDYLFLVDRRGVTLEILRSYDLSQAGLIRLDTWRGIQNAALGIAVGPCGEKLAVLFQDPIENKTGIRLCTIDYGELVDSNELCFPGDDTGKQVPRLEFDPDGKFLVVLTGIDQIRVIDTTTMRIVSHFRNEDQRLPREESCQFTVTRESSMRDWQRFGCRAMKDPRSRAIAISAGGNDIVSSCEELSISWKCAGGKRLSEDGVLMPAPSPRAPVRDPQDGSVPSRTGVPPQTAQQQEPAAVEQPGLNVADSGVVEQPGHSVADSAVVEQPGHSVADSAVVEQPGHSVADSAVVEQPGLIVPDPVAAEHPQTEQTQVNRTGWQPPQVAINPGLIAHLYKTGSEQHQRIMNRARQLEQANPRAAEAIRSSLRTMTINTIVRAAWWGAAWRSLFANWMRTNEITPEDIETALRLRAPEYLRIMQAVGASSKKPGITAAWTCADGSQMSTDGRFVVCKEIFNFALLLWDRHNNISFELCPIYDQDGLLAISADNEIMAIAGPKRGTAQLFHLPDGRNLGTLSGLAQAILVDFRFTSGGSLMAFSRPGQLQTWEADGNGNAWPWSRELVSITHEPVDESSIALLRQAQEMRRRGWLSLQESKLLDLALLLIENRLNLDIELDWSDTALPGDDCNIEIEEDDFD